MTEITIKKIDKEYHYIADMGGHGIKEGSQKILRNAIRKMYGEINRSKITITLETDPYYYEDNPKVEKIWHVISGMNRTGCIIKWKPEEFDNRYHWDIGLGLNRIMGESEYWYDTIAAIVTLDAFFPVRYDVDNDEKDIHEILKFSEKKRIIPDPPDGPGEHRFDNEEEQNEKNNNSGDDKDDEDNE